MADTSKPVLNPPGLKPVPYVIIKRADGTLALRHPDELAPPAPKAEAVKK